MTTSKAERLLARAAASPDRIERHLMVAAALREVLASEPIVIGGLAEDYYTGDRYQPTDLDLCAPVTASDERRLRELGFTKEGRHWYHEPARVAVEFPGDRIDCDESRVLSVDFGEGAARIIGVDDLYLDRLHQATMTEAEWDISFAGAVAIAASRFEDLDWKYVRRRIGEIRAVEPGVGATMAKLDARVRRRARAALGN
ncbi:MAG: hypothetical protein HY775_11460 [Acidobacteria bacterium]|nr:hypothetical protein [Acidobacteriota bacterium]